MIHPYYSFKLAKTKLKTRKILLVITIIVSSIIFGIIIAGGLVLTGLSRSADSYLRTALNNKYLVHVGPVVPNEAYGFMAMNTVPSDSLKKHLIDLQKQYLEDQKNLAKKYGVAFDPKSVDPILVPDPFGDKDSFGKVKEVINSKSPIFGVYVADIQSKWLARTDATTFKLRDLAVNATGFHDDLSASLSFMNTTYLPDGKEGLSKVVNPDSPGSADYVKNSSYTFSDQSLISRYILPENDARKNDTASIPVVITKNEAVKLFGKKLGINDEPINSKDKIVWMKNLQDKINGFTYQACYRNTTEVGRIQEAMSQNQTEKPIGTDQLSTGGSVSYTDDGIIYGLPGSVCSPAVIKKDNRTSMQKASDLSMENYKKEAGVYKDPVVQPLSFQIVGIMPDKPEITTSLDSLPLLVESLFVSQYQSGAFIPKQLYDQLPEESQHRDIVNSMINDGFGVSGEKFIEAGVIPSIVEFTSPNEAKDFIDKYTCPGYDQDGCNKLWTSQVYGPFNYLLIDDISKKTDEIIKLILPIVVIVASIIMSFTMSRVIIDSRRETAVFRALGAKRKDVVSIYITYSVLVSLLIVFCSMIIGFLIAIIMQLLYRDDITNYAKVSYGVINEAGLFSLIGINFDFLGITVATIIAIGVVAIVPPLLRNVRRNPINDLKDDL